MKTVKTSLQQEDSAYVIIANSLMVQIQNLESGPQDEHDTGWSALLARKMAQYNAICEYGRDVAAMMDYEERAERFEEAYEDHIAAMEPGSAFMESCYEAEEPVYPYGSFRGEI